MRFQHILEAVFHRPWLITEAGYDTVAELFSGNIIEKLQVRAGELVKSAKSNRGNDFWTDEPIAGMIIESGIATIPVHGPIGQRVGLLGKSFGVVDVADLESEIVEAESDDSVRAIMFDIDSPGGMASGTPELADRIAASSKLTASFSDGQVGSAAYWLSSSTRFQLGTRGSQWGGIGMLAVFRDTTRMFDNAGIKVKVFSSGKYKGMGINGTPLTPEQQENLDSSVMDLAKDFYDHVRKKRGEIPDDVMQGQMFSAKNAVKNGLIDGIVSSRAEALSLI